MTNTRKSSSKNKGHIVEIHLVKCHKLTKWKALYLYTITYLAQCAKEVCIDNIDGMRICTIHYRTEKIRERQTPIFKIVKSLNAFSSEGSKRFFKIIREQLNGKKYVKTSTLKNSFFTQKVPIYIESKAREYDHLLWFDALFGTIKNDLKEEENGKAQQLAQLGQYLAQDLAHHCADELEALKDMGGVDEW